jgi:hypothetical protein
LVAAGLPRRDLVGRSAGSAIVGGWRRFQSFGGWLAHLSNFSPGRLDMFRDQAIKPTWVFLWLAWLAVVATGFGLDFVESRRIASLVACGLVLGIALAMVLGVKAGYVACIPTGQAEADTTQERFAGPMRPIVVKVTGVVDAHSGRRYQGRKARYRERPATLERYAGGALRISVKSWTAGLPSWPNARRLDKFPCGYALLDRETVSDVTRATAYLATRTKPAIRHKWLYGPVILTFADATARDEAFAAIRMLRTTGPTEPAAAGLREEMSVDESSNMPA